MSCLDLPLRLAVFDLDGVLLDSWPLMQEALAAACAAEGRNGEPPVEAFRRELGRPLPEIARRLGMGERFVTAYEAYSRRHLDRARLYPGVEDALFLLRQQGVLLALATGKDRPRTLFLLQHFGLGKTFEAIVCGGEGTHGKPHPEPLQRILAQMGKSPGETVFVGDSVLDMQCARAAGVLPVAAAWGLEDVRELRAAGAVLTAHSMSDLVPRLLRLRLAPTEHHGDLDVRLA